MPTFYLNVVAVKDNTPRGVLRIAILDNKSRHADYFANVFHNTVDLDNISPTFSGDFTDSETPSQIASFMMELNSEIRLLQ
jgi:hypothetical protein